MRGSAEQGVRFIMPENLEKSILFTQNEFIRLGSRIKELE